MSITSANEREVASSSSTQKPRGNIGLNVVALQQLHDVVLSVALWISIVSFPLLLTSKVVIVQSSQESGDKTSETLIKYIVVDCLQWTDSISSFTYQDDATIQPILGLCLGLASVVVSQVFTVLYHWYRFSVSRLNRLATRNKEEFWSSIDPLPVQKGRTNGYEWREGLITHVVQVEGFLLLGGYLIFTWIFGWMPDSYYKLDGKINWWHVALQLLLQDAVQYAMHIFEHRAHAAIYKHSHKPHHRFTNPRLFDAFNGSMTDTILMILIPLLVTKTLVHANVWSYMAFGSLYSSWLTLIHSEWSHPWDKAFRKVGFGTAADHHVHHALFVYNFGHLFMYCDWIGGTYKCPSKVAKFNEGV